MTEIVQLESIGAGARAAILLELDGTEGSVGVWRFGARRTEWSAIWLALMSGSMDGG